MDERRCRLAKVSIEAHGADLVLNTGGPLTKVHCRRGRIAGANRRVVLAAHRREYADAAIGV